MPILMALALLIPAQAAEGGLPNTPDGVSVWYTMVKPSAPGSMQSSTMAAMFLPGSFSVAKR